VLPPAPRQFTLFFRFESDDLTDESRAPCRPFFLPSRVPAAEVLVVDTDTTGTAAANIELDSRAGMMRRLLLEAGLDASFIEVTSHGEANLLVPTADGTLEPRNRRVEITVK
jgi:outer membrane protein OmpA-like peptidoglycan-associated protein